MLIILTLFAGRPCSPMYDTFRCASDDQCILEEHVCDGERQCRDGSEEINCSKKNYTNLCSRQAHHMNAIIMVKYTTSY